MAVATMTLGPTVCRSLCEGQPPSLSPALGGPGMEQAPEATMHTPRHRRGHGGLALGSDWDSQSPGLPWPHGPASCAGDIARGSGQARPRVSRPGSGPEPSAKPSPYGLRVSAVRWADRWPGQLCLYRWTTQPGPGWAPPGLHSWGLWVSEGAMNSAMGLELEGLSLLSLEGGCMQGPPIWLSWRCPYSRASGWTSRAWSR